MAGGKLLRSESALLGESSRDRFRGRRKGARLNRLIEGCRAEVVELFVLRGIRQRGVWFQDPVDQFALLLLGGGSGDADEQRSDGNDHPHVFERAELSAPL